MFSCTGNYGGSHTAEWSFIRSHGVGFSANGAIHIGYPRFGAEIIHFIVQNETGTTNNRFASVAVVQGCSDGNSIAFRINYAKMSSLFAFFCNTCCYI